MRISLNIALAIAALGLFSADAAALLCTPKIFSDNMVLQSGGPVKIWGSSDAEAKIRLDINGISLHANADKDGLWSITVPPQKASDTPSEIKIFENEKLGKTIKNVLVGEVWIAAGQSNMWWPMKKSDGFESALKRLPKKMLRIFVQPVEAVAEEPQADSPEGAAWVEVSEENIGEFGAVGYFFGEFLSERLKVPVGIIETARPGSSMVAWVSRADAKGVEKFEKQTAIFDKSMKKFNYAEAIEKYKADLHSYSSQKAAAEKSEKPLKLKRPRKPHKIAGHTDIGSAPALLYNAKVAPIVRYGARGIIWYQGEGDSRNIEDRSFAKKFERLINSWRKAWGKSDMPFLFVQLTSYNTTAQWPQTRWQQYEVSKKLNAPMAVITDLGAKDNVHPRDKRTVAHRLANIAFEDIYNIKLEKSSKAPVFKKVKYNGASADVEFECFGESLVLKGEPRGFEILENGIWKDPKEISVRGNHVFLKSANGQNIDAVRCFWENWAEPNLCLFSSNGLPAMGCIDTRNPHELERESEKF